MAIVSLSRAIYNKDWWLAKMGMNETIRISGHNDETVKMMMSQTYMYISKAEQAVLDSQVRWLDFKSRVGLT